MTGVELDGASPDQIREWLAGECVFARVSPEHKLILVDTLREGGDVVAMTGDGVNDAPALKRADIGVAMGRRGTDVARGAADMVLADDHFASIVGAIEEGRRQFDNIQKFVRNLLSSNLGEIVAISTNVFLGGPLILLPVQILWMNLVSDGITAIALGLEQAERGLMDRPPRPREAPILDRTSIAIVLAMGLYMGLVTLGLFEGSRRLGWEVETARTVAFTGLILLELVNVYAYRTLRAPLAVVGWGSNPWVNRTVGLSLAMQIAIVHWGPAAAVFHTAPLPLGTWPVLFAVALPVALVPEWAKRRVARRTSDPGGDPE